MSKESVSNYGVGRILWAMNSNRKRLRDMITTTPAPLPDVMIGYLHACFESHVRAKADTAMLKRKGLIK